LFYGTEADRSTCMRPPEAFCLYLSFDALSPRALISTTVRFDGTPTCFFHATNDDEDVQPPTVEASEVTDATCCFLHMPKLR
jgi:hypothetical protein